MTRLVVRRLIARLMSRVTVVIAWYCRLKLNPLLVNLSRVRMRIAVVRRRMLMMVARRLVCIVMCLKACVLLSLRLNLVCLRLSFRRPIIRSLLDRNDRCSLRPIGK